MSLCAVLSDGSKLYYPVDFSTWIGIAEPIDRRAFLLCLKSPIFFSGLKYSKAVVYIYPEGALFSAFEPLLRQTQEDIPFLPLLPEPDAVTTQYGSHVCYSEDNSETLFRLESQVAFYAPSVKAQITDGLSVGETDHIIGSFLGKFPSLHPTVLRNNTPEDISLSETLGMVILH